MDTNIPEWLTVLLFLVIPFGAMVLYGMTLLFFPHKIVQSQGRYAQKRYQGFTDEEIDRTFTVPWERYMTGKRSDYVRHAADSPHLFPRVLLYYRVQGGMLLSLALCGGVMLAISYM